MVLAQSSKALPTLPPSHHLSPATTLPPTLPSPAPPRPASFRPRPTWLNVLYTPSCTRRLFKRLNPNASLRPLRAPPG